MIFAGCLMLFHLANAAMLPLTASVVTMRSSDSAAPLVAACILVPQVVVAALAPWVGRQSVRLGPPTAAASRFRGIIDSWRLAGAGQQPLHARGRASAGWNLGNGSCRAGSSDHRRCDAGHGPLQSRARCGWQCCRNWCVTQPACIAGYTTDQYGSAVAFFGLAALATVGFVSVLLLMPETGNGPSGPVDGGVAQRRDILTQDARSIPSNLRNAHSLAHNICHVTAVSDCQIAAEIRRTHRGFARCPTRCVKRSRRDGGAALAVITET